MKTTDTTPCQCPVCLYTSDSMTDIQGLYTPQADDITICGRCGTICIVQKNLTYKEASEIELLQIRKEDPALYTETIKLSKSIGSLNRQQ